MVSLGDVQAQLDRLGVDFKFWGRAEKHELRHILVPGEQINHILNGRYEGGFAMLAATNMRLLLIDKKPFYLTLEDIRYDMISEVDFSNRLIDSTIFIQTFNKTLRFTSVRSARLRALTNYAQLRVTEIRQHHLQFPQPYQSFQQPGVYQQYQQPQADAGWQPQQQIAQQQPQAAAPDEAPPVQTIAHSVVNPYTKTPLMMRRRIPRFYQ